MARIDFRGLIVDGVWEAFHNLLLRRFGKLDYDRLLSNEARELLLRELPYASFTLRSLTVKNGVAVVDCDVRTREEEKQIRATLLRIYGIQRVVVR